MIVKSSQTDPSFAALMLTHMFSLKSELKTFHITIENYFRHLSDKNGIPGYEEQEESAVDTAPSRNISGGD